MGNKKATKRKSSQFVGQTRQVGQYSLDSRAIFAYFDVPKKICTSEKFFWTPKMVHCPKFFWRRGGEGAEIYLFHKKIFGSSRAQSEKSGKFLSAPLIFSFPYAHEYTIKYLFAMDCITVRLDFKRLFRVHSRDLESTYNYIYAIYDFTKQANTIQIFKLPGPFLISYLHGTDDAR
jgi:hypothetical protein